MERKHTRLKIRDISRLLLIIPQSPTPTLSKAFLQSKMPHPNRLPKLYQLEQK